MNMINSYSNGFELGCFDVNKVYFITLGKIDITKNLEISEFLQSS